MIGNEKKLMVRVKGLEVTAKRIPGLMDLLFTAGFGRGAQAALFKPGSVTPIERSVRFYSASHLQNALQELAQHGVSVRPARRPHQK